MQTELIHVVEVNNVLGEGVIWDAPTGSVWWTDILAKKLFSFHLADEKLSSWDTPEELACFALVEGQNYLLAGFASGFAYFDPASGKVDWICKIEADNKSSRLNDGRTDRQGRFWAGSLSPSSENSSESQKASGALYCLDSNHAIKSFIPGIEISNSLCWSPDSSFMYHCDTPNQTIQRYAFDSTLATLGSASDFVKTEQNCFPDGSTIDADGFLLNAQWGGSKVVRYKPNGEVDSELSMPVSQPTCVAIGGPNKNVLFVTSANVDLITSEQNAGDLFIYKTDLVGVSESRYRSKKLMK